MQKFLFGRAAAVTSLCLTTMIYAGQSASAAGLLGPLSASEARAAATQAAPRDALIKRSRIVKLNSAELAAHVAPLGADTVAGRANAAASLDGRITIELFPDAAATFRRGEVEAAFESGYSWVGSVNGNPAEEAVLIVENGQVTGHIQLGTRIFRIEPLGNGLHRVIELNPSKFPPDHPKNWVQPPTRDLPARDAGAVTPDAATTTVKTITVLAAYTSRAAAYKGSSAKAVAEIKLGASLANAAYTKAKIPMKISLTGIVSTGSYLEWDKISANLAVLEGASVDGYPPELGSIRSKRTSTKSDLLTLFTGPSDACGIGNFTDKPSTSTKTVSESVVVITCVSNFSFGHELGHNMGLRHDRFVDKAAGVGYNFGHVNKSCKVRTMMAYDNSCQSAGYSCTRLNMFSTDRIKAKVGTKTCTVGVNKGQSKAADNEQRLKETYKTISAYR